MSSSYKVELKRPASKFLAKQDRPTQKRIIQALEELEKTPPEGDIKPMKGQPGLYRLRMGTYRAVYEVDYSEQIVHIKVIGNRGDVYKG